MEIHAWLKQAITALQGGNSPKRDAEIILRFVTGQSHSWLIAFDKTELLPEQLVCLNLLLERRVQGEPVAYLVGEREFWSLPLRVSSATLIPRPDTEVLVEQALKRIPTTPSSILDLGTGTGAIALALACERPDCQVQGVDRIDAAVMLARNNAKRLAIPNAVFTMSHWFDNILTKRFHLIVSNPPYIGRNDQHLLQGDVRFEPLSALVANEDGLADLRHLITQAPQWLVPSGWLLLEHGWKQDAIVRELMQQQGFFQVTTVNDYSGNPRVTLGQTAP
ncbi:peptide chain release factor N(5)-glutamine methyltransferase [Pantoea sp. Nvir]|uniref:peptide chain release factor N(5)-glutamine methyltransferase n=1 Tax=Pantoea sp. Nvir TaxID=2576760 RepID=UPI00135CEB7E|nr:peptide chain release factor N(5)-glutamine methyltransferase [Pantoea sp. Nvir]MXP66225.1 peptide chain release factor N(5)-glutamine methyltransferase [Pantoea sp. Nvir]CAJ0991652.1 Release factor glutamine methyltransferase [Pantoea sp. Nvir]